MKNEFVTYKQALALKDLGYNEPCLRTYTWDGFSYDVLTCISDNVTTIKERLNSNNDKYTYSAPLKQQVFRWFRERYLLDGLILPQDQSTLLPLPLYFTAVISYNDGILKELFNTTNKDDLLHYDTYEEAENACIDKLIELAKQ